jgi:hypothetical protein
MLGFKHHTSFRHSILDQTLNFTFQIAIISVHLLLLNGAPFEALEAPPVIYLDAGSSL